MGLLASLVEATDAELDEVRASPDSAREIIYEPGARRTCSLDKAWDGLYRLFGAAGYTLESELLYFEGGIGVDDCLVVCASVAMIEAMAGRLSQPGVDEALVASYAPDDMRAVYPDMWAKGGDPARDYLFRFIPKLRDFTRALAEDRRGALAICG